MSYSNNEFSYIYGLLKTLKYSTFRAGWSSKMNNSLKMMMEL